MLSLFLAAAQICQLMIAAAASPQANWTTSKDYPNLRSVPMFRGPDWTHDKMVMWSADIRGDVRLPLNINVESHLGCLLDNESNYSVPIQSFSWVFVDKATGEETRHRLSGSNRDISFTAGPLKMKGFYEERYGSVLSATPMKVLVSDVQIRCEYQLAGFAEPITSHWLYLWDKRTVVNSLDNASGRCRRALYVWSKVTNDSHLAAVYTCRGFKYLRLLESAVVSITSNKHGESPIQMISNSSSRYFFGYIFDDEIRFGWVIAPPNWGNTSALPGARLEQRLKDPGASIELMLHASLLTLRFRLPNIQTSSWVLFPPKKFLHGIVAVPNGFWEREIFYINHDELLDPLDRMLPCPLICLPGTDADDCQHDWSGPGTDSHSSYLHASQPLALHLTPVRSGRWICSNRRRSWSITYIVTMRPRPLVSRPGLPTRSVVFPPDRLMINCALSDLAEKTSVKFDVFQSQGVVTYNVERTEQRYEQNGSALLSLNFSDFSPSSGGAIIMLRCRAAEGERAAVAYSVIHVLPLPEMKPLDRCSAAQRSCRVDCSSPLAPYLRPLNVCVIYLFSLYVGSGKLSKMFPESTGVLKNAWKEISSESEANSLLQPECMQMFIYCDKRGDFSARQLLIIGAETSKETVRSEIGETNFRRLILIVSDKKQKPLKPTNREDEIIQKRLMITLIVISVLPFLCFLLLTCKIVYNCSRPKKPIQKDNKSQSIAKFSRSGVEINQPMQAGIPGTTSAFQPVRMAGRTVEAPEISGELPRRYASPAPWQQPIRRADIPRGSWEASQEESEEDSPLDQQKRPEGETVMEAPVQQDAETDLTSQPKSDGLDQTAVAGGAGTSETGATSAGLTLALNTTAPENVSISATVPAEDLSKDAGPIKNVPESTAAAPLDSSMSAVAPDNLSQDATPPLDSSKSAVASDNLSPNATPPLDSNKSAVAPDNLSQKATPPMDSSKNETPPLNSDSHNAAAPLLSAKIAATPFVSPSIQTVPGSDSAQNTADRLDRSQNDAGASSLNLSKNVAAQFTRVADSPRAPTDSVAATRTVQADSASTDSEARTPDQSSVSQLPKSVAEPTEQRPSNNNCTNGNHSMLSKDSRSEHSCHSTEQAEAVQSAAPATGSQTRSHASRRTQSSSTSPGSISGVGFDFCLNLLSDQDDISASQQ